MHIHTATSNCSNVAVLGKVRCSGHLHIQEVGRRTARCEKSYGARSAGHRVLNSLSGDKYGSNLCPGRPVLKKISSCVQENLNQIPLHVNPHHVENAWSEARPAIGPKNRKVATAATFQSAYALLRVHLKTVIVIIVNVAECDADPTIPKID